MAPAMVHLLENVQSHFVNSDSPVQPPGQQSLDREYGYEIQPGLVNSGSNYSHVEYRTVQPSSTLMPPECVTTISSSELAKKICKSSTTDPIHVDSMWNVVIGGIIFFVLFMVVVAMLHKTFWSKPKRGNTLKSIDRPSSCEEPFDVSYDFQKSLPSEEVKFQVCPGTDEEEWTDSFCREHYAPLVHYPGKPKKNLTYHTF